MATLARPDDVSGPQKALTQMRAEGMKDTILKVREEQAMQSLLCSRYGIYSAAH